MRYNTLEPIINYCNVFACVVRTSLSLSLSVQRESFWRGETRTRRLEKKGNNMENSFTSGPLFPFWRMCRFEASKMMGPLIPIMKLLYVEGIETGFQIINNLFLEIYSREPKLLEGAPVIEIITYLRTE